MTRQPSGTPGRASNCCICHQGRESSYYRLRVHISWHRKGLQCQRWQRGIDSNLQRNLPTTRQPSDWRLLTSLQCKT